MQSRGLPPRTRTLGTSLRGGNYEAPTAKVGSVFGRKVGAHEEIHVSIDESLQVEHLRQGRVGVPLLHDVGLKGRSALLSRFVIQRLNWLT